MYWSNVKERIWSSVRLPGAAVNESGWLGTVGSTTTTVCNEVASDAMLESTDEGTVLEFDPPVISIKAELLSITSGTITCTQCCQSGLLTSAVVRQVWLLRSRM